MRVHLGLALRQRGPQAYAKPSHPGHYFEGGPAQPPVVVVGQAKLMWQLALARWTDGEQKVHTKEVSHIAQSPRGVLPCCPRRHTIPRKQWPTVRRGNGHLWENPISPFNFHSQILPPPFFFIDLDTGSQKCLAHSGFKAGGLLPKPYMSHLLHEIISRCQMLS